MLKLFSSILVMLLMNSVFGQDKFVQTEKYMKQASRAFAFYEEQKYLQSALSYDTLFKFTKGKGLRSDKYNAACSWALVGNKEKAFFYLSKAIDEDKWSNLEHMLSDSDLNSLHSDNRWQPLIDYVKTNKKVAEAKLNKPLVDLLDTIFKEDQTDRIRIDTVSKQYGWKSRQIDSLWKKISYQDSVNLVRVKKILDSYGWLGPDEIGDMGATTLFLVIQHSDSLTQVTYLPMMRDAVKKGKALPQNLALLEDRVLVKQGKKQIYGSQLFRNDATGKYEFNPIEDEANVNKRRLTVGLPTLEEYAKMFGINYVLPKPAPNK